MAKVNKTLTLNRWHKVVDRLNQAVTEATSIAQKKIMGTSFNVLTKQANRVEDVARLRQEGLDALHRAEMLLLDIAAIRSAIGAANVQHEITQKLAQVEISNRIFNLYKIFENANDGKIDFSVFWTVQPVTEATGRLVGNANSYNIKVLGDSDLEALKAKADYYKKNLSGISDEVADLNRMKLSVDISEAAVEAAALSD